MGRSRAYQLIDAAVVSTVVDIGNEAQAREHAIKAGEYLQVAKAQVKHGGWLPWLDENFEFTQQTANGYMRITAKYGTSRDLPASVNAALAELAELRELKDKLAEEVERFDDDLQALADEEPETDIFGEPLDGEVVEEPPTETGPISILLVVNPLGELAEGWPAS